MKPRHAIPLGLALLGVGIGLLYYWFWFESIHYDSWRAGDGLWWYLPTSCLMFISWLLLIMGGVAAIFWGAVSYGINKAERTDHDHDTR